MESRAKAFGHPIHPMLIVFPLGLLATALGLDVAYAITERQALGIASYWNIAIGVVAGLLAVVTGWLGGELVARLGIGVDRDAHLDAPSSLTDGSVRAART